MAFNKGDRTDASKVRRGGIRRRKKYVCSAAIRMVLLIIRM